MVDARLTRRGLFRGVGTAALLTGCKPDASEAPVASTPGGPAPAGSVGPGPAALRFELNGEAVALEVAPHTTLAEALRIDLDRTGTKIACDRGACGACMVLVDGRSRNSCMTLAHDVAGAKVETVEGLAEGGELSALQRAFVEHDALQCGFCTSGMLISCADLLRRHARDAVGPLTADAVNEGIAGNMCRCGTYPHVVEAVLSVAGGAEGGGQG